MQFATLTKQHYTLTLSEPVSPSRKNVATEFFFLFLLPFWRQWDVLMESQPKFPSWPYTQTARERVGATVEWVEDRREKRGVKRPKVSAVGLAQRSDLIDMVEGKLEQKGLGRGLREELQKEWYKKNHESRLEGKKWWERERREKNKKGWGAGLSVRVAFWKVSGLARGRNGEWQALCGEEGGAHTSDHEAAVSHGI